MPTYYMTDLRNDYVHLVNRLLRDGQHVTSRGLETRELTGVTLEFLDPTRCMLPIGVNRGVNLKLAAVEALQLLAGEYRHDLVERAAPGFINVFVDPGAPDYGAYGPRITKHLQYVVWLLGQDPTTRRAVAMIWEPKDLMHDGDRPCTLTLQFLVRQAALELHVTMRSQDAWLGLTYDAFMFSQVQLTLARYLGIAAGRYVHHVGSFHLYETDVDKAQQLRTTDAELPSLPQGIDAGDAIVFNTATRLLHNEPHESERTSNAWYTTQIGKLYD